jgi:hypothetical protein
MLSRTRKGRNQPLMPSDSLPVLGTHIVTAPLFVFLSFIEVTTKMHHIDSEAAVEVTVADLS